MACTILHHPDKNYLLMLRSCLITGAVLCFGAAAAAYFLFSVPSAVFLCISGLLFVFAAVFFPEPFCKSQSYVRLKSKIIINSGVLFKKTVVIERAQMQCVTLRKTPLERIFGLCSVVFCCSGARYTLCGLSTAEALRLRKLFEGELCR